MSEIKRWLVDGNSNNYPSVDGPFVLHSDHEAEVARLRAELQNAAKAALDAVALSCEKEREADELRVDAMRYRWLRNKANDSYRSAPMVAANPMDRETTRLIHSEELDAAIDAAMGASA